LHHFKVTYYLIVGNVGVCQVVKLLSAGNLCCK